MAGGAEGRWVAGRPQAAVEDEREGLKTHLTDGR